MSEDNKQTETPEKKDPDLTTGERIQKRRKELGLSVEDLATLTSSFDYSKNESEQGISSQTLYRYEKNEREPGTRETRLLCYALNVSADWLIFGKLWNAEQGLDSALASKLRALIKDASDLGSIERFLSVSRSRDQDHFIKLTEVMNKKK